MNNYLYCEVQDFSPYIPDLPKNTTLIQCTQDHAQFFHEDEDLVLDCEAEIWAHGLKRKYFRKVLYAHFGIDVPPAYHEHYILYYICEPEK